MKCGTLCQALDLLDAVLGFIQFPKFGHGCDNTEPNAPHTARGDGGRPPEDLKKLSLFPPGRRYRLSAARLTCLIQRFDSPSVALLVRVVIALGHRHRLVAGEVVDLLDRDAEERLLRIDFFPVVADSVEEEIEGHILGQHWGL